MISTNLTLYLLIILHALLSSAEFFSKSTFSNNSFRNTIRMSNLLDPDQARHYVRPDLDPKCLQRLSADDTRRQKVKVNQFYLPKSFLYSVTVNP